MVVAKVSNWLLAAIAAIGVAACAGGAAVTTDAADAPESVRSEVEYQLGPGDELRIIVFGEEDLSGEFIVDGGGAISLPLIGEVNAEGLSLREFQGAVEARLAEGYLNDPRVSAEVLNYRPFFILGEVNAPGEYPYREELTVLNAVATAEGFTYRADTKRVFIKRAGAVGEREYRLSTETKVQPGDTIRIPERFF